MTCTSCGFNNDADAEFCENCGAALARACANCGSPLKPGARLFHYIGDPESRFGANVTRGVVERIRHAGFTRLTKLPQAFGILAYK